jgi:mono/diheme cytochrome c family protein
MTSFRTSARRELPLAALMAVMVPWAARADNLARPSALVRRGEQIAQERCSACHVVAEKQEYPPLLKEPGPSFQSIANRPEKSRETVRKFVATTHWDLRSVPVTMPNPELSRAEALAVISYIFSLKKP